ncbi:mediator of RNA polymerase II transcription subunit 20a-like isoform X10 [Lycium ferocissimum]|uniref:mediator of RNA polymerase II transcription subunit 20a-like isoform X10 n=1 Tax=Lycium ferocissimum TaxID=112874 RepID=UPI002814B849|nr:mediator of RNA polymerase II transcription subunit 20a-like isoform X10 [Lycium ferocissimum]
MVLNKEDGKLLLASINPCLENKQMQWSFPRLFWEFHFKNSPTKYYFVIRGQRMILEAESSIQTIMEKLQSYKRQRMILEAESSIQTIMEKLQSYKTRVALNFEMEYLPISSWEKSHQIMGEFFDIWQEALGKRSLPGHFVHIEPIFSEFGLSDQYTSQHTAVQYASIMAQMIATAQSAQAVRN